MSGANKVKAKARSGYYKSGIIIASSVVEGLMYKKLEKGINTTKTLKSSHYKGYNILPKQFVSKDGNRICLCERIEEIFSLGKQTDFKRINETCLKLEIISKETFIKLEKIRQLRNKLHIQSLEKVDRSYTKKELEFVLRVLNKLM